MAQNNNIKDFYKAEIEPLGSFGSEQEFTEFISDPKNAKDFFEAEFKESGAFANSDEFVSFLGVEKKNLVGNEPLQSDLGSGGLFSPLQFAEKNVQIKNEPPPSNAKYGIYEGGLFTELPKDQFVAKLEDTEFLNKLKEGNASIGIENDPNTEKLFENVITSYKPEEKYAINGQAVSKKEMTDKLYDRDFVNQLQEGKVQLEFPNNDTFMAELSEKQKQSGSEWGDKWESIKEGALRMASGVVGLENYVKDFLRLIPIFEDVPESATEQLSKIKAKELQLKAEEEAGKIRQYEDDFVSSIESGNYLDAVNQAGNVLFSSAAPIVATIATGGASGIAPMAAIYASGEYAGSEGQQKLTGEKLTQGERIASATISGTAESVLGSFPTSRIVGKQYPIIKEAMKHYTQKAFGIGGQKAAEGFAEEAAKKTVGGVVKDIFKDPALEVLGETANTGINILKDINLGIRNPSEEEIKKELINTAALSYATGQTLNLPSSAVSMKKYIDQSLAKNPNVIKDDIKQKAKEGKITDAEAQQATTNIEKREKAINAVPTNLQDNTEVVDLIEKKQEIEEKEKQIDPIFKAELEKEKADINAQIQGIIKEFENEPTTAVREPIQEITAEPEPQVEEGVTETVSESVTEDSGGGAERTVADVEQEQLLTPKIEEDAKEQQSGQMREQSVQEQPQRESDSDMPIVNETELQDGEVVEEEVTPEAEPKEVAKEEEVTPSKQEQFKEELLKRGLPEAGAEGSSKLLVKALTDKNTALNVLDIANKNLRELWSKETGIELPKTQKGTREVIDNYFKSDEQKQIEAAGIGASELYDNDLVKLANGDADYIYENVPESTPEIAQLIIETAQEKLIAAGKGDLIGSKIQNFTDGKQLNKLFKDTKEKYGDKKGANIYDATIRLVNPNQNEIVEIRSNGVVVKQGDKYTFKPFTNTDANSKKWTLGRDMDITEQFVSPKEAVEPQAVITTVKKKNAKVEKSLSDIISGKLFSEVVRDNDLTDEQSIELAKALAESTNFPKKQFSKKDKIDNDFDPNDNIDVKPIDKPIKQGKTKMDSIGTIVSKDELRPIMQGVFKDSENKRLVATDAMKMVIINDNTIKKTEIVEPKTGRIIEGNYPKYDVVIPKDNPIKRKVNVKNWLSQLNGLAETKRFFEKTIAVKIKVGDQEFAFDSELMRDVFNVMAEQGITEVELQLSKPSRALVVESNKGVMGLVMPFMFTEDYRGGSKTLLETEMTIDEKNGVIQQEIDSLEQRRKEKNNELKEAIQKFRNATAANAYSLEFDVEYHKKRLAEIDAEIAEKKSELIDNPIQEKEDLQTVKTNIENGEITTEQAAEYIAKPTKRSRKTKQSIEDIESKAESDNEAELNEVVQKTNALINAPKVKFKFAGGTVEGTVISEEGGKLKVIENDGTKYTVDKKDVISEIKPKQITKKDIDEAKKSLDENLNKINKLFEKPKEKGDDKVFSQLIPKSIFGLPFRAADLAEKFIYEKVIVPVGDAAAKALRKGMESSNSFLNEAATQVQSLIRTAPLTTEEITARRISLGEINSSIFKALRFYQNAVNSVGKDPQSLRNIHMVLDPEVYINMGETPLTYDDLNDSEKNLHDLLRATNDAIHDWHFINGKIDKETYDANKGKYIARFYEEIEFDDAPSTFKKSFEDISKQMNYNYIKQRKDLDEITLKALEDPVYATARRLGQMLKNQAIIDYANQASTKVKTFNEGDPNIPNNYVKLEGGGQFGNIKIWGDLTNKYVPIDLAEDLKGYMFLSDAAQAAYDFNKAYDRLSIRQFYKKFNTVYNPLVHVGNAVSNFTFAFWTGIDPITLVSNVPQATKEVRENGDIYLELARQGVVAADVVTKDLTKSSKDILTKTQNANNASGAFRKIFEKFDDFVTEKYAGTDDIAKVAAYISLVKDYKVDPKEAAKRVFDGFQNYSQVGRIYDFASKTPIIGNPYVKFKADLLRIIKNATFRKPLTMIGYLMLLKGFADLMSNIADEDEEDKRRREARPFIPKIPFPKALGGDIPLVFQTKYGEVNAARYFSPFYIYDDANKSGILEKASQFAPITLKEYRDRPIPLPAINDVLFGSIVQAAINEDFRGKRIQDPSGTKFREGVETSEERLINALNYIARQQVPFYSKTQDLVNALNGDTDFYGRNKDLKQSLISSVIKIEQMGTKEIKESIEKNVSFAMKDLEALEGLKKKANKEYEEKAKEIQASEKTQTQKEKAVKTQLDILTKRLAQLTEKQAKIKSDLLEATGVSIELKPPKSSKPQMGLPKQTLGRLPKQRLGQ